jgi:hypothetical protein
MARNCPKNTNLLNISNHPNACETTTTPPVPAIAPTTTTSANSMLPPIPPKLTIAQQIHTLEENMTDKEHGNYLDACNMGKDFCSAAY